MPQHPEFVRWCEQEITTLREELAALGSGSTHIGRREAGGPWIDITEEEIRRLTALIEDMEAVLRAEPGC